MTDPLDPEAQPPQDPSPSPQETPPPVEEDAAVPAPTSAAEGPIFPAMGQGQMSERDEKFWASLGHLLSLSGIPTGGIGYVVGPLIPFLLKKGESPFVDEHNKETLNFSIVSFAIIWITGAVGFLACVAWIATALMALLNLIYCIQGASAAREGKAYRYPFNLRLIK